MSLSEESREDTGLTLFHMDSGIGIACSSCHPEGGEDGHVWRFPEGPRRTLLLQGGVMERAPFHWDGSLATMDALVSEVMVKRMAITEAPLAPQITALGSYLEQLPAPAASDGLDTNAVSRGRALFYQPALDCVTCHAGPQFADNQLHDVGTGGNFVTPTLLGVGLRSPLLHDGCAKQLEQRFSGCGQAKHGHTSQLSAADLADLIVFLRSL